MQTSIKAQRTRWLKKTKLTPRQFAERVDEDYGTAQRWLASSRTPRRRSLLAVLAVFPDWPHAGTLPKA